MSVGPIVAALAGVPSGRLVDRLGTQATTVAGLVLTGSKLGDMPAIYWSLNYWPVEADR
jgi:hypothetical protein